MELTREHFDKTLAALYKRFDRKIAQQTAALKALAEAQTDAHARTIAQNVALPMEKHFEQPHGELSLRERLGQVESDLRKIKTQLHSHNESA